MDRVRVDGCMLRCRLDGPGGNAPWLVFSNSLATDLSIWDAQAAAFASTWNILRYDQRGHGGSDIGAGPIDFARLGADVRALMDHYNIARCVYAGLSMGVPTGLAAYRLAPDRFHGFVFLDGQARSAPGADTSWSDRIETARRDGMAAFATQTAGRWLTGPDADRLRSRLQAMIAATAFDGFALCANALKSYDLADVLPAISCPTLLLAGRDDGAMPATMSDMAGRIAKARFETIDQAGHVPCFEQPTAVNAAISGFLTALEMRE